MKKLLILATLLLALVLTVVACKGGETPEVTTGPDVEATEPATGATSEEPTEDPTEEPTEEPDVPTETVEDPTETAEPTVPTETQEPTVTTEEPTTEEPVDPNEPLHTVEPDFLANYANQTGNLTCVSDVASHEVITEGGRTFIRLTSGGTDPYIAFIDGQQNLQIGRYMAISYRTNSVRPGHFFMGSGGGWNGQGDMFAVDWNEDSDWNLMVIDLDNVGLTALTDNILNYARVDFFHDGAAADTDYFDIEYIGFFNSAEAAELYDFEMHKAPMWDADKAVVTHQSFDELTKYLGGNAGAGIFTPGESAGWDKIADLTDGSADTLRYWGWVGVKGEIGQFGYQINGGKAIYDDAWTVEAADDVKNAAAGTGADTASRMQVMISLAGLGGENTIRVLYKAPDGNVVCLNEFTVILPEIPEDITNKFESDVNSNAEGTDLQASDLVQYFTIQYGAGDPHKVEGGLYQYGGINEMFADMDGLYAYIIDISEAANTSMAFVRGAQAVNSVDLPAQEGSLYVINNYYETDGNGMMGGAGIYAAVYGGKLNIMVKVYDDATKTHVGNKHYAVRAEGTELTIADDGNTVYFLVDGKLYATIALSGEVEYEKLSRVHPLVKFAQTAVVTLNDGTTETIENTLVASTHEAQIGIALRPANMKFSSLKVLGFSDVTIPEEFYVPEVKENIALGKPVTSTSVENDTNIPANMTDGDENTRFGALPNGTFDLIVDLEAVYTLSGMDIFYENASWNYEIALSTDGENYTKIYDGAPHGGKMLNLTGTIDARYIKFTRLEDDGNGQYWFSIYELYVYGTAKEPVIEIPKHNASVDYVMNQGPEGAPHYTDLGASSLTSDKPHEADFTANGHVIGDDYILSIGGWMAVNGGINKYVYSVNGGDWIDAVGGVDGEPLPNYFKDLGMADGSTKNGMFNEGNMLKANLEAYAGQTVTVVFAAVAESNGVVVEIVTLNNVVVPAKHEHSYEAVVTDPTCTEAGYTTYTCACGDTYTADETAALGHSYADGVCSVCGEADPDYVAPPAVEMPAEFALSLYQANLGKTLYFNGQMSGNFLAMSANPADAVQMYSEKVEGGYRMYFLVDGVKNYVEIYEYQTGKKGVHITTEPAPTYYEWSVAANTWITWLVGCDDYAYLGTYNSFDTISSSWISYITGDNAANVGVTQFVAQWGEMPEVEDHEHSYEAVVTDPTCTEAGYTTYTCTCGDTYTADEVAAAGHNYVDGVCGICGEAESIGPEAPAGNKLDIDSFDLTSNNSYAERVNADGWTAVAAVRNDQTVPEGAYALILNGKVSAPGSLTSPTLAGGISKISFKAAYVFSESGDISLKVTITGEDGTVITTDAVFTTPAKNAVCEFEYVLETPITGNFTIKIENNCPSAQDKNKDRCSIWDLTWESAEASEEEPSGSSYDNPIELSATESNTVNLNVTEDGMGDYPNGKGYGVYVTITVPVNGTIYFTPSVDNLDVAEVSYSWDGTLYTEWGTPDSSYSVYAGSTYVFLLATRNMKADTFTIEIVFEEAQPELYNESAVYVTGQENTLYPSAGNYSAGAWVGIYAQGAELIADNAIMSLVLDSDVYSFELATLAVGEYSLVLFKADGTVCDSVDFSVIAYPVPHFSFDQIYSGSGDADEATNNGLNLYHSSMADWDGTVNVEGLTEITAWGWAAYKGELGSFGYYINGDSWSVNYDAAFAWTTEDAVVGAAQANGGDGGSRFKIVIPVVAGTYTVDLYYKNADGVEVIFKSFTMTSPKAGDSADNPLYVTDAMTTLDMGAYETVYLYIRNPNGMVLSTDSYVTIVYNGQEYPASYGVTEIIFTEAIGEGALVAVTAGEWGAYAYFTLSEYVPPISELPLTTDISTDGWNPGEITIQAPATGTLTMTGGDNCSFLIMGAYGFEWIGDGTATLEVLEGQTYTIGVTSADWNAATFTVTFSMGGDPVDPVEPVLGSIDVTTTDNNGYFDLYTFTAEAAGTYTFTVPAGLGFYSKASYDAWGVPEIDFYSNTAGHSFSIDLAAGEAYSFYIGATEKADWTISYSFVASEVSGGEDGGEDEGGDTPVVDISGTYYAGEDTVVIDTMMGTLVYTFTSASGATNTAEYTFEIVDGAVVLSNANGVISDASAIIAGKLELDANGAPSVFWYNGYSYALTLGA